MSVAKLNIPTWGIIFSHGDILGFMTTINVGIIIKEDKSAIFFT